MKALVAVLFVLSAACSVGGLALLATQTRNAVRLLREPTRHVIDGGDASGNATGPNAATALDDMVRTLRTPLWAFALLLAGILAGLAGDLLSLNL